METHALLVERVKTIQLSVFLELEFSKFQAW